MVWIRTNPGGLQLQPALCLGGLQVEPAPCLGGLQVQPAPEPATKAGPAAGGRNVRVLPEAGAVHFPIFSGLQIEPTLCKNTHIQ